jgi:lysophospholipase L1-like esterase
MRYSRRTLITVALSCLAVGALAPHAVRQAIHKVEKLFEKPAKPRSEAPAPTPQENHPPHRVARNIGEHAMLTGLFDLSIFQRASIVMLGDSITAPAPWNELTGCPSTVKRGIPSEKTADVLTRLDQVTRLHPRAVFLMIGINDVAIKLPVEQSMANMRAILQGLSASKVFLHYLLPVGEMPTYPGIHERADRFNEALTELVPAFPNVTMIDLRAQLRGPDGWIKSEMTKDEIHLSPAGFRVWRDAIDPLVHQYCTAASG